VSHEQVVRVVVRDVVENNDGIEKRDRKNQQDFGRAQRHGFSFP
jgi:hypothetical protein